MSVSRVIFLAGFGLLAICGAGPVLAEDAGLCLYTAQQVQNGERITEEEKQAAHEACQRALAATASIVQKYHLQEADFEITGTRPKKSP